MRWQMLFYLVQQRVAGQQVEEVVGVEPACVSGHSALLMTSGFMSNLHGS